MPGFVKNKIKAAGKTTKKAAPDTRARARTLALVAEVKKITDLLGPHQKAAVQVWVDGLKSVKRVQVSRDVWEDVPDDKERRENAFYIISYLHGKQHELQVQINADFADLGVDLKKFQASPESIRMLNAMAGGELPALTDSLQSVSESNESSESSPGAS